MRALREPTTRRTPLVAAGFLAGAVIGALPPVQHLPLRWQCAVDGGRWLGEARACEFVRAREPDLPGVPALSPEPLPLPRPEEAR